jgi:hypothetical protein
LGTHAGGERRTRDSLSATGTATATPTLQDGARSSPCRAHPACYRRSVVVPWHQKTGRRTAQDPPDFAPPRPTTSFHSPRVAAGAVTCLGTPAGPYQPDCARSREGRVLAAVQAEGSLPPAQLATSAQPARGSLSRNGPRRPRGSERSYASSEECRLVCPMEGSGARTQADSTSTGPMGRRAQPASTPCESCDPVVLLRGQQGAAGETAKTWALARPDTPHVQGRSKADGASVPAQAEITMRGKVRRSHIRPQACTGRCA